MILVAAALADDLPLPEARPGRSELPSFVRWTPVGWRTLSPVGPLDVSARTALVFDTDAELIAEGTVRAQAAWPAFGVATEMTVVGGASPHWSSAGLGNLIVDARAIWGRRVTQTFGLRGSLAVGNRAVPVNYWGSVPEATVPMWGVSIATSGALERTLWDVHIGFRTNWQRYPGYAEGIFDVGGSVTSSLPLPRGWDLVGEFEAILGPSPVHLRALVRHPVGPLLLDVGLALPVVAIIEDPSLQLVASGRWRKVQR